MMDIDYYRDQADRSRRFAREMGSQPDVRRQLLDMAQDFDDIAEDLEVGAIEVRHPEWMPELRR